MTIDIVALLNAAWDKLLALVSSVHALGCLIGIVFGMLLSEFIAHILPPGMDAYAADRITRLVCLGASFLVTFALDTTLIGFLLAVLSGLAGPTLHGFTLRYVAARWPQYTPRALIPGPCDTAAPRPILPIPAEKKGEP